MSFPVKSLGSANQRYVGFLNLVHLIMLSLQFYVVTSWLGVETKHIWLVVGQNLLLA